MRYRILLVDDEPRVAAALKHVLHRAAYETLSASSGAEALELLGRQDVDVVVADEQMPGMRGTELLAKVRELHPQVVRIMLTGHASLEVAVRAINEGEIFRFLLKPCQGADLAVAIRQALQHRELLRKSGDLLALARHRGRVLAELEEQHPGIGEVRTTGGGAVLLEPLAEDLPTLLRQIEGELQGAQASGEIAGTVQTRAGKP